MPAEGRGTALGRKGLRGPLRAPGGARQHGGTPQPHEDSELPGLLG